MTYRDGKEKARSEAIQWQADFADHVFTWGELLSWQDHFARLGKRYGLTKEFRENGII